MHYTLFLLLMVSLWVEETLRLLRGSSGTPGPFAVPPHPMCHHLDCFPALLPSSSFPCDAFASHGTFLRCHNKQSFQCCDWSVPWDTVLFDNTWVKQWSVYRCVIPPTAGWSKNSKFMHLFLILSCFVTLIHFTRYLLAPVKSRI